MSKPDFPPILGQIDERIEGIRRKVFRRRLVRKNRRNLVNGI